MDDGATRATAIAKARSLLIRDGDKFTLALLCTETGLSRASLRRAFPTKAALISAVLNETVTDSHHSQSGLEPAHSSNLDSSVAADSLCTDTDPKFENSEGAINEGNSEPVSTAAEDDLTERLFHLVQRAIAALDTQLETPCGTQYNSIASLEQRLSDAINARTSSVATVEPPPLISEYDAQEPNVETIFIDEFEPISTPSIESVPPPTQNITLGSSPSRLQMLTILENARRSQSDAKWMRRLGNGDSRIRLVDVIAATFAALLTIAGLFWVHHRARGTEAPVVTTNRHAQESGSVALIDTIGFSEQHSSAYVSKASSLVAQATGGSLAAQTALAEAFLRGTGEERDPFAAVRWSLIAAQRGEPSAQFILGTLYFGGIKPDPRLAVKWFFAAASHGNLQAMHNLGVALLNGEGVARDPAMAVVWFSRAAKLGYRDSAFDLAVLYERGEGVRQDSQEALRWYDKAFSAGDREAGQRASVLRSSLSRVAQK